MNAGLYGYRMSFTHRELPDGSYRAELSGFVHGQPVRWVAEAPRLDDAARCCRLCFRQWLAYAGLPIFE